MPKFPDDLHEVNIYKWTIRNMFLAHMLLGFFFFWGGGGGGFFFCCFLGGGVVFWVLFLLTFKKVPFFCRSRHT